MLATLEVPREFWGLALERLERQVEGLPVRIEVEGMEFGDQELTGLVPLRSLDLEEKGSGRGDISFTLGNDGQEIRHVVQAARCLYLGQSGEGPMEWLAIEDESGKTFVYFERLPALGP